MPTRSDVIVPHHEPDIAGKLEDPFRALLEPRHQRAYGLWVDPEMAESGDLEGVAAAFQRGLAILAAVYPADRPEVTRTRDILGKVAEQLKS